MTHITTGCREGILTREKLFSSKSSSFLYLERFVQLKDWISTGRTPCQEVLHTVLHHLLNLKAAQATRRLRSDCTAPLPHWQAEIYLSSAFPSEAMADTRSSSLSRSSSNTDWWNSSRGVPCRSKKGRADCREGSSTPFSVCESKGPVRVGSALRNLSRRCPYLPGHPGSPQNTVKSTEGHRDQGCPSGAGGNREL